MGQNLHPFRGGLVLLWLFSYYSLYLFAVKNGFLDLIWSSLSQGLLPDGTPIGGGFTGISIVDIVIGGLVSFFWPILHGNNPYVSLSNIAFAGQFVACYTLAFLEETRRGNKGRGILSAASLGMIIQMHGFATVIPLYLCLHLSRSGTTFAPTAALLRPKDYASLQTAPIVILFAYIFPTIFVSLPTPAVISHNVKVNSTALWLIFPAFGYLLELSTKKYLTKLHKKSGSSQKDDVALLRRVYAFGLAIAAVAHIYTVTVSISAHLLPGFFNKEYADTLVPGQVLVPTSPFRSDYKVSSIDQGVHVFMQWDYLIAGVAYNLWALAIRYAVQSKDDSQVYAELSKVSWAGWLEVLLRIVVLGPIASALSFLWERDETVFAREQGKAI